MSLTTDLVHRRLADLGLSLPAAGGSSANYLPWRRSGLTVYLAGQVGDDADGNTLAGTLGGDLDVAQGYAVARSAALNLLAQIEQALGGDWSRLAQVVRLGGFVRSTPDFGDQPKVINGASDLFVAVLGDAGRHARTSVGVAALPEGAAVEIDAIIELHR